MKTLLAILLLASTAYSAPFTQGEVDTLLGQEDRRSWGEYKQTDTQTLTNSVFVDITCDGGERDEIRPAGATAVWDTATSHGVFLTNGAYTISLSVTFTTAANNNSVTLRLENVADTNDFLDAEITLDRTGVEVTHIEVFELISTGSVFKMRAKATTAATVEQTRVFAKREY